jgi:hypothetical protein
LLSSRQFAAPLQNRPEARQEWPNRVGGPCEIG